MSSRYLEYTSLIMSLQLSSQITMLNYKLFITWVRENRWSSGC
jgi:hypothetical protein